MENIVKQLEKFNYSYCISLATKSEVETSSACGQLKVLTESINKRNESPEDKLKLLNKIEYKNGICYCSMLPDGSLIEHTDGFLPAYISDNAVNKHSDKLEEADAGDRTQKWMIGISTMTGCPCGCKMCTASSFKNNMRNLTPDEMWMQVEFALNQHKEIDPLKTKQLKISLVRLGDPGLNLENVKKFCDIVFEKLPNAYIFISTIGIKGNDFSWINGKNITLQFSIHSLNEERRNWLIPFKNKMTFEEIGKTRVQTKKKISLNFMILDEADFDIDVLRKYFDPEFFFIKFTHFNPTDYAEKNGITSGLIYNDNLL